MTFLKKLKPYLQSKDPWKQKAWDLLEKRGLPTRGCDSFKYVSLTDLWNASFVPQAKPFSQVEGAVSLPLEEGRKVYFPFFQKHLKETLDLELSPFALLNEALSQEGQWIYVPPEKRVDWMWNVSLSQGLRMPRVEIIVGKGGHLSLVFQSQGTEHYFYAPYLQIHLEEGASATIHIECEHSLQSFAMHTVRAFLKKEASLNCFVFSKGARCERHDFEISLNGTRSAVDLKGLSLPSEKDAIHHCVTVKHRAEESFSMQNFKGVLMDSALSSFQGKILIEKKAQQATAYQLSRHLLLSPKAKGMSQPNLEIFADDVKASHGATISQLKKEDLFYLQARGLTLKEARKILVQGFCENWADRKAINRLLKLGEEGDSI